MMKKDLHYNSSMPDHEKLNERTLELKRRVDEYIRFKLSEPFITVDQKECKGYIADKNYVKIKHYPYGYARISDIPDKQPEQEKTVEHLLEDFVDEKKKELKDNYHSFKKYITLKNGLLEFGKKNGKTLTLDMMNQKEFIYDLRSHLSNKGYNDNATSMRIKNLKTFFRFLEEKDIYHFNQLVYNTRVKTYENEIITLTRDEIQTLIDLEGLPNKWRLALDLFIANCFMGLRHNDLYTFDSGEIISDKDGNLTYKKRTGKQARRSKFL
jgi:integrase